MTVTNNRPLVGPHLSAEPAATPDAGSVQTDVAAKPAGKVKKAADGLNQGLGADGVLQDSTRAISLGLRRAGFGAKVMRVVADFTNGEGGAVDRFVRSSTQGVHNAAVSVSPGAAGMVDHTVAPAMAGAGRFFSVASKYAQVIALPFAYFDVRDAVKAKDPKEKRAAIANATFSVAGGLAGAVGGFIYNTPVGLPLLVLSTTTGLFQIVDHFVWKGKGMDMVGEHIVAPLQGIFHHH